MRRARRTNLAKFILMLSPCLVCAAAASPQGAATGPVEDTVAACRACHQGPMALSGRTPKTVAAAIREIREGQRAHPPLPPLAEKDIEVLAERLASQ